MGTEGKSFKSHYSGPTTQKLLLPVKMEGCRLTEDSKAPQTPELAIYRLSTVPIDESRIGSKSRVQNQHSAKHSGELGQSKPNASFGTANMSNQSASRLEREQPTPREGISGSSRASNKRHASTMSNSESSQSHLKHKTFPLDAQIMTGNIDELLETPEMPLVLNPFFKDGHYTENGENKRRADEDYLNTILRRPCKSGLNETHQVGTPPNRSLR